MLLSHKRQRSTQSIRQNQWILMSWSTKSLLTGFQIPYCNWPTSCWVWVYFLFWRAWHEELVFISHNDLVFTSCQPCQSVPRAAVVVVLLPALCGGLGPLLPPARPPRIPHCPLSSGSLCAVTCHTFWLLASCCWAAVVCSCSVLILDSGHRWSLQHAASARLAWRWKSFQHSTFLKV